MIKKLLIASVFLLLPYIASADCLNCDEIVTEYTTAKWKIEVTNENDVKIIPTSCSYWVNDKETGQELLALTTIVPTTNPFWITLAPGIQIIVIEEVGGVRVETETHTLTLTCTWPTGTKTEEFDFIVENKAFWPTVTPTPTP